MRGDFAFIAMLSPILVALAAGVAAGFYDASATAPSRRGLRIAVMANGLFLLADLVAVYGRPDPAVVVILVVLLVLLSALFVLPAWAAARNIARH